MQYVAPETECLICMEEGNIFTPAVCPNHTDFCQPCLQTHASLEIKSARIPIGCPHADCNTVLQDSVVEAVFGMPGSAEFAQDFAKYGRFKQMKSNPNARECSRCSELCNPPADATYASASAAVSAGSSSAQSTAAASDLANKPMKCKCGHAFCWEHGDLHPGKTCKEYLQSRSAEAIASEAQSMAAILENTKPCPNCETPISHAGGCNHVVCSSCNKDFCWTCGTDAYMTGKIVRSCKGCGNTYMDHRQHGRARWYTCLSSPLWISVYLIYLAVLIFLYALTLCCCFCCMCGKVVPYDEGAKEKPNKEDLFRTVCVFTGNCDGLVHYMFPPWMENEAPAPEEGEEDSPV